MESDCAMKRLKECCVVAVAFPAPVGKCFEGLRTEEVVSCCCCCLRWVGAEE